MGSDGGFPSSLSSFERDEAHQRLTRAGRGGPAWRLAALPRAERADSGPFEINARSARRFAFGSSLAAGSGDAASPLGAGERMLGRCRGDQHVAPPLGCQALWGTQDIHKLFGRGNAIGGWKRPARLAAQSVAIGERGTNNGLERRPGKYPRLRLGVRWLARRQARWRRAFDFWCMGCALGGHGAFGQFAAALDFVASGTAKSPSARCPPEDKLSD